jgi:hypothetical protein
VTGAVRETRDWRPAFDTLRPLTAALWSCLGPDERADFLSTDAAWWDLHRHRMPPSTAAAVARLRADGALQVGSDEVLAAEETRDGLVVVLASGRRLAVDAVVNCTGPQGDVRRVADPLIDDLLASGTAVPGPLGLGLRTHDGRVVDASGAHDAPVWTLGAMRRGELFETTAVPEIRGQAAAGRRLGGRRSVRAVGAARAAPGPRRDGSAADDHARGGRRLQPRAGRGHAGAVRRGRGVHRGRRAGPRLRARARRPRHARPRRAGPTPSTYAGRWTPPRFAVP